MAGLEYEAPALSLWGAQWATGFVGGLSGLSITEAYTTRMLKNKGSPLLQAMRVPYAVVGTVVSATLCYNLADLMVLGSAKFAKMISFTLEGFLVDTVGFHADRARSWEQLTSPWYSIFQGNDSTSEHWRSDKIDDELQESRERISILEAESPSVATKKPHAPAVATADNDTGGDDGVAERERAVEQHLNNLCRGLINLRREERKLKSNSDDAPEARATIQEELVRIERKKQQLKDEAFREYNTHLGHAVEARIKHAVESLSQLRIAQHEIATRLRLSRDQTERARLRLELVQLDTAKRKLKARAMRDFHQKISVLAVKRRPWKAVVGQ